MILTPIFTPEDFERAASEAIALTKPEQQPAPVISIDTRERL
jgi:hypothetical protein